MGFPYFLQLLLTICPILGFCQHIFAATYNHDKNYSVPTNTCIAFYHNMQWNTHVTWFRTTRHLPAITMTIITIAIPLHAYSKGILLLFIYILLLQLLYNSITNCTKCSIEDLPFSCQNYETFIFAISVANAVKNTLIYHFTVAYINSTTYNTYLVLTYEP